MELKSDSVITRNPSAIETTVGSEIVLMLVASGECFGLGETGSDVWRQIAEPVSLAEVIAGLRAMYDAPEGALEQDVDELLERWADSKLIVVG